jgi:flagellar biosynthesis/type III secretory pathway M-ring protein FliF/YscJ
MPTWSWIIIGIAAAAALAALVFYGVRVGKRRRIERRRAEARVLREEAQQRLSRAEERESVAGSIAAEAKEERKHAQKLEQRAGKLDPSPNRDGGARERDRKPRRGVFSRSR